MRVATFLVGQIPNSFDRCERSEPDAVIDVAAARRQHDAYVAALAAADVIVVDASADHPDAVFVEDTAVVIDHELVVLTRPGAPSRRGEVDAVTARLPAHMTRERLQPPATLDGGDVLRVRDHLFIGLSARTNEAGAAALAAIAERRGLRPVIVRVPRGLHLKSACTIADDHTLLHDPTIGLPLEPFTAADLHCIPTPEPAGANILALGTGRILVSTAAPATADLLQTRGFTPILIDASEVHKADGGLTCCSIRIPAPGDWCT